MKRPKTKREIVVVIGACVAAVAMTLSSAIADPQGDESDGAVESNSNAMFAPPSADEIAAMIKALGDESHAARQEATSQLWQLGVDVLPDLKKASEGADPEAADRANELVFYISAGVLFDSSEEVKELVIKYANGDLKTKFSVIKRLNKLGNWKQLLYLAQMEKDPVVRNKLSKIMIATASRAAQEAVVAGDLELAEEMLQLSGGSQQAMVVRAWFYCRQGKFDAQLEMAKSMSEKRASEWRLALYRAHGDLNDAIREAKNLGLTKLVATLQVLAGDPRPWLNLHTQNVQQDAISLLGAQIQMAKLSGDKKKADEMVRELTRMATSDEDSGRVISNLAANGYQGEALALLEKFDVDFAFEYYDSIEAPQRALAQLNIPKDAKPPYTDWVKEFTRQVIEDEDKNLYNRLLMLASFLVRHGEGEHAMAVLEPMMTALEDNGSDVWFDLIGKMPNFELGAQAVTLIEKRGNEDGEADLAIKKLLGTSTATKHLWGVFKKRNGQDLAKSLHEMALLAGLREDPENETDAIHQALLAEATDLLAQDKKERYSALFSFAIMRHEIATASRMVDGIVEANEPWRKTKLFLDATLQRWKKVEPVYAATEQDFPGDYFNLVKWSCVLRKLGSEPKAKDALGHALLLTMGNVSELNKIGLELANAGFKDDAVSLWKKTAMMAPVDGTSYDVALVYLANTGSEYRGKNQWRQAASIAEVYSRFTMRGRSGSAVMSILNARFRADFYLGMFLLENGQRDEALAMLDSSQKLNPGSGSLADDFFPILRKAGVTRQYNQWFEASFQHLEAACKAFPKAHNSHNTTAWLAARAMRRLDDALRHSQKATSLRPTQGAYLDTMAEIWFAKGNRKKAIKWSNKAIDACISHAQGFPRNEGQVLMNYSELKKQLERFEHDPLPVGRR